MSTQPISLTDLALSLDASLWPPEQLSPTEAAGDIAILMHALKYGWAGWDTVGREEHARRIFASMWEVSAAPQDTDHLCRTLAHHLDALPDAHFDVSIHARGSCGPKPVARGSVGENIARARDVPWHIQDLVDQDAVIRLVGIARFMPPDVPAWRGFLDRLTAAPSPAGYVIDLRGNGGGADTMAYWIAQSLSGKTWRRDVTVVRLLGPVARLLCRNRLVWEQIVAAEQGAPTDHIEAAIRSHDRTQRIMGQKRQVEFRPTPKADLPGTPAHCFAGPIAILVDERCGSSGENALDVLRKLPHVTVFGQPTAGAIHFGQAGLLALPHSKALVTIATQRISYDSGGFWEKKGFSPDVTLPDGQDALDAALCWMRKSVAPKP